MANYKVLGSKGYDFEKDGKHVIGAKLYYLDEPLNQGLMQGYIPFNVNVTPDDVKKIPQFPCVCDIDFKKIPDSKGKAIEVFDSLDYVEPLSL